MSRPVVVFSHANGFPGSCYRRMHAELEPHYPVAYKDRLGHDPRYPVTDGWPHLVAELVDYIESLGTAPVIGVGHSLGGYLTFIAAVQRPDLFRAIVLLDAPIMSPWKGTALAMVKRFGLVDRVTPAGATRARRREWPSADAALAHFRGRGGFRDFDPGCLEDYVATAMVPGKHGLRLAFDPEVEYRIYRSIPHDLAYYLPRLKVPAGFIGGTGSYELRRVGLAITRKHFRVDLIEGGHLFPFEKPRESAHALQAMLGGLLGPHA